MSTPSEKSSNPLKRVDLDGHDLPPSPAPSSPRNGRRKYALATELVYTDSKDQYGASSIPIYQSATFKQSSASGGQQEYDYTRSGNPTRTHLERHVAKIMNANRALAVSSGMGALDVITRLLRPGDEVITGDDLYGGSHRLLTYLAANQGIVVHHVDTTTVESVQARVSEKTAMVLLETPTNPLIKIVDIPSIAALVHDINPKALVVVDNTMLSPMLANPLDMGADITYESGTKYLSGHHDIMAGVMACNDNAVADRLFFVINSTGCGLSPNDSFLLMRGIKTLAIRMEKQQASAQAIAEFLESKGFRVRYPGLKSHPQYDLHWSMARGAGAVLSFETGDSAVSQRIVEAARLWGISVSFGCVNSLISMPCQMSHASIDAKTRRERQMPEDIIRLCVGIEDVTDLIDDLSRALVQAGAVTVTLDGFHATGAAKELGETPLAG
ncbi:Cys/Met metabolism PLP-dependent enzyme-domain-containing protein [Thelonectria olida]|uniref:Cystathionine beta-lyase n=1 Tax=Thelonectria olida TaxID=1576542 RepID=A0A9P8WHT1_9HYPO|nr:Cys/Met metabolism PLP-dependent enzyme-domain-containing protein [Thelonectria olida]